MYYVQHQKGTFRFTTMRATVQCLKAMKRAGQPCSVYVVSTGNMYKFPV